LNLIKISYTTDKKVQ